MTKIVVFSDTHQQHNYVNIPSCDIAIHVGDYSNHGTLVELLKFSNWFSKIDAKHKLVCNGNHDWYSYNNLFHTKEIFAENNIRCLQAESITINGINLYFEATSPEFCGWAWMLPRNGPELKAKWDAIPESTDILVTHGPSLGHLDWIPAPTHGHVGCNLLADRIREIGTIKYVLSGHIHCSRGIEAYNSTTYINAAICDESYNPTNDPIVFEIDCGG